MELALRSADRLRAGILKRTLVVSTFRRIFFDRPLRLGLFFGLSAVANLGLALRAPLWALVLMPLALGAPHLVASMRYAFPGRKLPWWIGAVFVAMAALRVWNPPALSGSGMWPEVAAAAGCFLVFSPGRSRLFGLVPFGAAAALLARWPAPTLGALVFLHNGVSFPFWIARAPTPRDRTLAWSALAVFLIVTVLLFAGAFDVWMGDRGASILGGAISEAGLGSLIFPTAGSVFFARAVSAYAFGQGIHYFVWLKAIPEQELPHGHPTSISQSVRSLRRELGGCASVLATGLCLGFLVLAAFVALPEARGLYVAVAAFHGFFELAGLPFLRGPAA